jgi:glycosyltransferase involved in cell wall biosynthesis
LPLRILFLTQVLPYPLTSGAKIRAYYALRHLAQRHAITLVSFVRPDDQEDAVAHLAAYCEAVHTVPMTRSSLKNVTSLLESAVSGRPAIIVRDRLPAMERLLARLVIQGHYDAVHADQTSMAQYALFARSTAPAAARPAAVLDQHNALYLLVARQSTYESWPWRLLWRREARALAAYERGLVREFDQVLTVTEEDKAALLALCQEGERPGLAARITPIPICVDPSSQPPLAREAGGQQIIHLGTMFWPPNIEGVLWFAEQVLPLVRQEVPRARFVVAGMRPPAEVQALAEDQGDRIEVTGFVADPRPLLAQSQVFIVPVRAGGGMRVKIVDAWLWGLPIVSTTIGAEGLQVRDGKNLLLADEPQAFARAVVRLLREPGLGEAMGRAGRQWVEAHYDYRRVYGQFDEVYGRF